MKKKLVPIFLLILLFCALPAWAAGEFETLHIDKEDIENNITGDTVSFKMMDKDKSAKRIDIDDAAVKYLSEKKAKFIIETINLTLTASPEAFKTSDWAKAVKTGEPLGIRLIIKKGDAVKVSDHFDEWYYNPLGLSRFGTSAWDISGEILVGGVKEYDITSFALPLSVKLKYPLTDSGEHNEKNLEVYVLNEETEKWNYLGGTVDREKRIIDFKTSVPGLMIILSNEKSQQFVDIKGHWAESDILYMIQKNVVQNTGEQRFFPNQAIKRGEFAVFLVRTLGLENTTKVKSFTDVTANSPYYQEIMAAANSGIVTGTAGGKFLPEAFITREEIAVLLTRALKYKGLQSSSAVNGLDQFSDRKSISPWAAESVSAAVKTGIMSGRKAGIFAPKESTSKAEAVVLLRRLMGKLGN